MNIGLVYSFKKPNQSIRIAWGLKACGIDPFIFDADVVKAQGKFDYILVEASVNVSCLYLKSLTDKIILYDTEDKPRWFSPGLAYEELKEYAIAYGKYNYQPQYPNPDGLKHIGLPQVDYINKGAKLTQEVLPAFKNVESSFDIFFNGGASYLTDYKPKPFTSYLKEEDIWSVAKKPEGTGRPGESDWLYNQRLEWIHELANDDSVAKISLGLSYNNEDEKHPLSMKYHSKLFGPKSLDYKSSFFSPQEYYTNFIKSSIGLCPAGVARSSYRLIELMALGRIIISTDTENYKYLYNPNFIIEIPDGASIASYTKSTYESKDLIDKSRDNMEVFKTLTPAKMWTDFIAQIN